MNPNPAALRILIRLGVYLCVVVLLGCLLAPPLYWAGTALASRGVLPFLDGFPFHRYFSRCMQISALAMLWPFFRGMGWRKLSEFGLEQNCRWRRDLGVGIACALIPVLLLGLAYLAFDIYRLKKEVVPFGMLRIFGTAAAVSVIEEFLFRGVILGLLLRIMHPFLAALLSSVVFAAVHFMRIAKPAVESSVEWWSGFAQLPQLFSSAPAWPLLGWGMLSLFLAGLVLAFVTVRTRSLFLAIGLHAGWIFGQQGMQWLAKFRVNPPGELLPWVGQNVVSGAVPTGIIPVFILLATAGMIILYLRNEKPAGTLR